MHTVVHNDPVAASSALSALGLTEDPLLEALKQGYMARTNCTENHPAAYPSTSAWAETVRALREQLAPQGWVRNNANNYSRTIHPDGHIAIVVATGNEATGVPDETPTTKSEKGPITVKAVKNNKDKMLWIPGLEPIATNLHEDVNKATTWLLLIHHASDEIRSELSLPFEIGSDGRVNEWHKRIILRSIPLDNDPLVITQPSLPDLDVEIRRKA